MSEDKIIKPVGRRHRRGYLPHFDAPGFTQFVTFRLADSLPKTIFDTLQHKLETRQITEIQYYRAIDKALDQGEGPLYLQEPTIADMVAEAILRFHAERYLMYAWVIMPNHVHLLFEAINKHTVSGIMHSIKGFTATQANRILGRRGRFWSPDYFDRFIRGKKHFLAAQTYIENNPVKAGLCKRPEDWRWSGAGWR